MAELRSASDGDDLHVAALMDEMTTILKDATCLAKRMATQHRHAAQKRLTDPADDGDEHHPGEDREALALVNARRELLLLERRRRFLENVHLFGDPAWSILIDLYVRQRTALRTTVSSACIASGAPTSTGMRYVKSLQDDGWLMKRPDPHDLRRTYVELTPEGMDRMTAIMASDHMSPHQVG
jgi:DNA repair protein RadC